MMRLLFILAVLLLGAPVSAQLACAALPAAIAGARGGERLVLAPGQDCPGLRVSRYFAKRLTIVGRGSTIRGLVVMPSASDASRAGNLRVTDARLVAPGGIYGPGASGYAAHLFRAEGVTLDRLLIEDAYRGAFVSDSRRVRLVRNVVQRIGSDGFTIAGSKGVEASDNRFADFRRRLRSCAYANGSVVFGTLPAACKAAGGDPTDDHADVIQVFAGGDRLTFRRNVAAVDAQGIGYMGRPTDPPPTRVVVEFNGLLLTHGNGIRWDDCIGCRFRFNTLGRVEGSARQVILTAMGRGTVACGNTVADGGAGTGPCDATAAGGRAAP